MCVFSFFKWCFIRTFKLCIWLFIFPCKCLCFLCPPVRVLLECFWGVSKRCLMFAGGFMLGLLYYCYLLSKIPFSYVTGVSLAFGICFISGIANAVCSQLRCISLLTFPMYCGKPGRGVLKAVVLTGVVAGPITNMALNAREVVRVFACSNQLQHNLSRTKYSLMTRSLAKTVRGFRREMYEMQDTLRSIQDVVAPIESEMEDMSELPKIQRDNDYIDSLFKNLHRSDDIQRKFRQKSEDQPNKDEYQTMYLKKLEYRCQHLLSHATAHCMRTFEQSFERCRRDMPRYIAWVLCWPMKITNVCNVVKVVGTDICDSRRLVNPSLGEGYAYLKKVKNYLSNNFEDIKLQQLVTYERELYDIQDPKETGERIQHAFEEKMLIMRSVVTALNVCVAILFLRIIVAAGTYHELYLTSIQHDNVYVTGYFKKIDRRRRAKGKVTLLPLKKMERSKYIDVHSCSCVAKQHNKLLTQTLKVTLEVVTATTFVMLDRLFYEALEVVRQHAETASTELEVHDLEIEVDGEGVLASMIRKLLPALRRAHAPRAHAPATCAPHPRRMPAAYFLRIYGGYLWVLLLVYLNPYTMRLRRLICGYFYPRREKQRILHLYNDILKKRMKMPKTLRRTAVRAARAHYLAGEGLLSLRTRLPRLLGWLRVLPDARMTCLICGETEPRNNSELPPEKAWYSCARPRCPFVYCPECWREVGERCLACDPSLAELSDIDSLSEDELPRW